MLFEQDGRTEVARFALPRQNKTGGVTIADLNSGNALPLTSARVTLQNNTTSPDYGKFFNPIERSIGFVFGLAK